MNFVELGFRISSDRADLDLDAVHRFLSSSYWAQGIPRSLFEKSVANSLPFGLFHGKEQIGFARVITDRATFGYLADVYVLKTYRGRGLGRWLVETVLAHPELQNLRRFLLVTRDASSLYEPFGFVPLGKPDSYREIVRPSSTLYR